MVTFKMILLMILLLSALRHGVEWHFVCGKSRGRFQQQKRAGNGGVQVRPAWHHADQSSHALDSGVAHIGLIGGIGGNQSP